jgi:hypothetical protein
VRHFDSFLSLACLLLAVVDCIVSQYSQSVNRQFWLFSRKNLGGGVTKGELEECGRRDQEAQQQHIAAARRRCHCDLTSRKRNGAIDDNKR